MGSGESTRTVVETRGEIDHRCKVDRLACEDLNGCFQTRGADRHAARVCIDVNVINGRDVCLGTARTFDDESLAGDDELRRRLAVADAYLRGIEAVLVQPERYRSLAAGSIPVVDTAKPFELRLGIGSTSRG